MSARPHRRWTAATILAALAACRPRPPAPATAPDRPAPAPRLVLADSATLGAPFLARQRVTASYGDERHSFEATLQLHGGVLRLLALTPFGTKAFLLEQRGVAVTYTPFMERELGFDPRRILADVHRALFLAAPGPVPAGDGVRAGVHPRAGSIREQWRGGRLVERRFLARDGAPEVIVTYRPPVAAGAMPEHVRIDARRAGYVIEIETLSWQPL